MRQLSLGPGSLFIGAESPPSGHVSAVPSRDAGAARQALQGCALNEQAMKSLRELIEGETIGHPARRMSDLDVIDRAALLVSRGELQLSRPALPPLAKGRGVKKAEQAAPRVSAAPAPSSRSAPSDQPSFIPNLDQAALAATLAAAAEDGTPFCEECARAAAQAA